MDLGLDGRTALVTGGGGRIGSEDCHALAAEGASVVVLDVNESTAEATAESVRESDVAPMVAYLASEQARYVTGQVVGVTGGVDLFAF